MCNNEEEFFSFIEAKYSFKKNKLYSYKEIIHSIENGLLPMAIGPQISIAGIFSWWALRTIFCGTVFF